MRIHHPSFVSLTHASSASDTLDMGVESDHVHWQGSSPVAADRPAAHVRGTSILVLVWSACQLVGAGGALVAGVAAFRYLPEVLPVLGLLRYVGWIAISWAAVCWWRRAGRDEWLASGLLSLLLFVWLNGALEAGGVVSGWRSVRMLLGCVVPLLVGLILARQLGYGRALALVSGSTSLAAGALLGNLALGGGLRFGLWLPVTLFLVELAGPVGLAMACLRKVSEGSVR